MVIDAEQLIKLHQDQRYGEFMATFTPPFFTLITNPDKSVELTTLTPYGIECVNKFLSGGEVIVKELGELDPLYFEFFLSTNKDFIKEHTLVHFLNFPTRPNYFAGFDERCDGN